MDASEDEVHEEQDDAQNDELVASNFPSFLSQRPTATSSTSPEASSTPVHPKLPAASPPRASTSPLPPALMPGPSHFQFSTTRSPATLRDVLFRKTDISHPIQFQSRNLCHTIRERDFSPPPTQRDLCLLDESDDSDNSYPTSQLSSLLEATDNDYSIPIPNRLSSILADAENGSLPYNLTALLAEDTTRSSPSPDVGSSSFSLQTLPSPEDFGLGSSAIQILPSSELILDEVATDTRDTEEESSDSWYLPLRRRKVRQAQQHVPRSEQLRNTSSVPNSTPLLVIQSPLLSSDSDEIDFPALIAKKKLVAKQLAVETSSSSESNSDEEGITGPSQATMVYDRPTSNISEGSSSIQRRARGTFLKFTRRKATPFLNSSNSTSGRITTRSPPAAPVEDGEIAGFIGRMKVRRERLREIEMELRDNLQSISPHNVPHESRQQESEYDIEQVLSNDNHIDANNEEQGVVIERSTANTPRRRNRTVYDVNEDRTEPEKRRTRKQRRGCVSPTYPTSRTTGRPNIARSVPNEPQTTDNDELNLLSQDSSQELMNSNSNALIGPSQEMVFDSQEMISSTDSTFRLRSSSRNITEVDRSTDDSTRTNSSVGIDTGSSISRRSRYMPELTVLWSEPDDSPCLVRSALSRTGSHSSVLPQRASVDPVSVASPRMRTAQARQRNGEDVTTLTTSQQFLENLSSIALPRLNRVGTSVFSITPRQEADRPRTISSPSPLEIRPISLEASNRRRTITISSTDSYSSGPVDIRSDPVDILPPSLTNSSAGSSSSESGPDVLPGASPDEPTTHSHIEDEFLPRHLNSSNTNPVEETISDSEEVALLEDEFYPHYFNSSIIYSNNTGQGIFPPRIRLRRDRAPWNPIAGASSTDEVVGESSRSYEADMAEAIKRSLVDLEEIYQSSNEETDEVQLEGIIRVASPEVGQGIEQDRTEEPSSLHPGCSDGSGRGGASSLPTVSSTSNLSGQNWQLKYNELLGKHLKLIADLQSTVECPVCMEIPRSAPIPCCLNGHVMCATCRSRSRRCPTCRRDLRSSEGCVSHVANQLVELLPHPCTNRDDGCLYQAHASEVEVHERDCKFRLIKCPSYRCKKQVCMKKLDEHINRAKVPPHAMWSQVQSYPLIISRRFTPSCRFSLQSFEPVRFIFDGRQCFLQTVASENKKVLVFYFVQMCGTREDCERYSARIEVSGKGGFTASQVCQVTSLDLHCQEDQHLIWNKFVMQDRVFLNMLHPDKSFTVHVNIWKN